MTGKKCVTHVCVCVCAGDSSTFKLSPSLARKKGPTCLVFPFLSRSFNPPASSFVQQPTCHSDLPHTLNDTTLPCHSCNAIAQRPKHVWYLQASHHTLNLEQEFGFSATQHHDVLNQEFNNRQISLPTLPPFPSSMVINTSSRRSP